jgi:hypothetical protein
LKLFLTLQHIVTHEKKIDCGRCTPTYLSDRLLWIIIANETTNENCLRWNLKDILLSKGVNDNPRIKTLSPILLLDIILQKLMIFKELVILNQLMFNVCKVVPIELTNSTSVVDSFCWNTIFIEVDFVQYV